MKVRSLSLACLLAVTATAQPTPPTPSRESVSNALHRAIAFFHNHVAIEGTYLWQYSADLSLREGEEKATATQGWVQPPGTPAVGMAFLDAWQATSDDYFLAAARLTAQGLVRGQLRSGGWTYRIDFSPAGRAKAAYRDGGGAKGRNVSTFDDDTTQAALRFLMRIDAALKFKDAKIHEAAAYGLKAVLRAQYPNGAWPQGYEVFPDPAKHPVQRATFPESWPRTWPGSGQYWLRYTLNDNALVTVMETLFQAARTYEEPAAGQDSNQLARDCRRAMEKAGDFLLLAQLPEPQPAWAQQYDFEMHPSWARKFEPPSVTAGESQRVLRALILLYRRTGNRKYLEPIPRALAWLQRSRLPDGRLARFYELRSNRPLYFTRDYQLTYADDNVPTHYAFKVSDDTAAIVRDFEAVKDLPPSALIPNVEPPTSITPQLQEQVRQALAGLDAQGRWIESGRLKSSGPNDSTTNIIRTATFSRNVETLSRYLKATR